MSNSTENKPIVIDNGAYCLKAGYAGDSAPSILIPMITGRPYKEKLSNSTDWFIGEHANALRKELILNCPVSNGVIQNFDELSMVWYYMFMKELRTNPANHSVLITEYPLLPKSNREQLAEMVFEKFHIPAMYVTNQSVLSLYACGRTTGFVFDMGADLTTLVPINNTYLISDAIKYKSIAGSHITELLRQLIALNNSCSITSITREFARNLKERLCYVKIDSKNCTPKSQTSYKTPDGYVINITNEHYTAPELFFTPNLGNINSQGLHYLIKETIDQCPTDLKSIMYSNIILSGGGHFMNGFSERLTDELNNILSNQYKINIHKSNDQKYAVWIGGSILASLSSFEKICVKKKEYDEIGSSIIHSKCI